MAQAFRNRSGADVRAHAVALARDYANQRLRDGDPEGHGVLQDLAKAIRKIPLRERDI